MHNPKIILKDTESRGKGIFTRDHIKKDEPLFEFEGWHLHYGDELHFDGWTDDLHNHAVQIGPTVWISNEHIGRYINHSCEPNCGVKGLVTIVAMRDIFPGEELTYDYEMTENQEWRMECQCGTPSCRKIIGAYRNMPEAMREKYTGYISEWLL